MRYFDYENVASKAGLSQKNLEELCRVIRLEFPRDEMMFELHVLRVCLAILEKRITFEDAIRAEEEAA